MQDRKVHIRFVNWHKNYSILRILTQLSDLLEALSIDMKLLVEMRQSLAAHVECKLGRPYINLRMQFK